MLIRKWYNDYMGDYHAIASITLQELSEIGFFDWEQFDWSEYATDFAPYH